MKADIYVLMIYSRLQQATVLNFTTIFVSENVVISADVLRDRATPKYGYIAVVISLPSCIQGETDVV